MGSHQYLILWLATADAVPMKRLIFSLALVATAVLFGSLLLQLFPSELPPSIEAGTSVAHTPDSDSSAARGNAEEIDVVATEAPLDTGINPEATIPAASAMALQSNPSILAQATSYSDALRRAANRTDADATYDRAYIAFVCGDAMLANLRARRDIERSASREQQVAFFERFCDRPAESDIELQRALELHADSDAANAGQLDALFLTDPKFATDLAMQLLLESESPDAIKSVQRFLRSNRQVSINLGDTTERIPSGVDAIKVRGLAIEMLGCSLSGACGSNSVQAWQQCGALNLCAPGISLPQIWQASYSNIELEHARKIAAQLLALRHR